MFLAPAVVLPHAQEVCVCVYNNNPNPSEGVCATKLKKDGQGKRVGKAEG